ncbi:MAG: ankyrin repeat protein [Gammaproteobacteria bacterium]|jgi:ankyrin repeat protein
MQSYPHRSLGSFVILLVCLLPPASVAQTPPSEAQIQGFTGLHAAAHAGNISEIERLIAAGAKPDTRNERVRTALHIATFARQAEAIRTLTKAGATLELLDGERYDPVTIAAVANDELTLSLLLLLGASAKQVTSRYDGTALIAAAHLGHDGVVKQLSAAGAPLDHVNNLHWTALIEAVVLGDGGMRHIETVRALVSAGADTQLSDSTGRTPLQLAKANGYREIIEILHKAGAR